MSKSSGRRKGIKTKRESTAYKNAVKHLTGYQNTNDNEPFQSLQGSNEDHYQSDVSISNAEAVGVKRKKIKKFLKEHWFEELIAVLMTVVITLAGWMLANVIELREKVAVFEYRIESAESNLESLTSESVTKEFLQNQLDLLKLQLQSSSEKELMEIETKIKLIEAQIEFMRQNQGGNN